MQMEMQMPTKKDEHKNSSQRDLILKHMTDRGPITPIDALHLYGCLRLAARIFELRRDGHKIAMETVTSPSSKVHWARYWLE